jgi:uncharacterized membrane protein (DUF2068 family)
MLLLMSFEMRPAQAVNHPAATMLLRDVAHSNQVVNVGQSQRYIAFISNSAHGFIQVIRQAFHLKVSEYFRKKVNNSGEKFKHNNIPQMFIEVAVYGLIKSVSTCGFSKKVAE